MGHAGGDDPEQDEHNHRPQKTSEPAAQPIPIRRTVPTGRIPGDPVGIASDKEEDGHHLHHPSQPPGPRRHIKQVADVDALRIHPGRGHQPMAHHHHEDRDRPQEIDAAIPLRRRLLRQSGGGAPKGLHAKRENNASPTALDTLRSLCMAQLEAAPDGTDSSPRTRSRFAWGAHPTWQMPSR